MSPELPLMPASSLPQPLTRLIGRDAALAEARELLLRQGVRLVTFSGTGGIGKTRLALELATDLSDRFVDGVWFIPLDGLNDSAQVLSAIMLAAGVAESATQVQHDVLRTSLSGKHVLLVLDNFEHVIDAAPEVASLLRECPCLTILVTSRTLLRISGEQVFPVPPLEHADAASPAVALFSERASAILPSFRLNASTAPIVEDICRLLDGLPLAIELAAARVNTLSLSALRDRLMWQMMLLTGGLRDAPKRHRTMRDAIAWSFDFLSADEQVVLRRL
jgi:non-specific serine/threonine protein kinase